MMRRALYLCGSFFHKSHNPGPIMGIQETNKKDRLKLSLNSELLVGRTEGGSLDLGLVGLVGLCPEGFPDGLEDGWDSGFKWAGTHQDSSLEGAAGLHISLGPFTLTGCCGHAHGEQGLVSFPCFVVTVSLFPRTVCEIRLRAVAPAEEAGLI